MATFDPLKQAIVNVVDMGNKDIDEMGELYFHVSVEDIEELCKQYNNFFVEGVDDTE